MFALLEPTRGKVPPQHRSPTRAGASRTALSEDAAAPATYAAAGREYYGMPSASQRMLWIWKIDGNELYNGLSNGFYDWGRTVVRAVNVA